MCESGHVKSLYYIISLIGGREKFVIARFSRKSAKSTSSLPRYGDSRKD